jgi:hypothetical protein
LVHGPGEGRPHGASTGSFGNLINKISAVYDESRLQPPSRFGSIAEDIAKSRTNTIHSESKVQLELVQGARRSSLQVSDAKKILPFRRSSLSSVPSMKSKPLDKRLSLTPENVMTAIPEPKDMNASRDSVGSDVLFSHGKKTMLQSIINVMKKDPKTPPVPSPPKPATMTGHFYSNF